MMALIGYMLRSYTRSQRYFAPFAALVIAVMMLYTYKPNPIMNSYAATAVILFVGCAWIGLSFLNHEHAVQRQVVIVHLRSARLYCTGGLLTLVLLTLLLAAALVLYPLATRKFAEPVGSYRLLLAFGGHIAMGLVGISISLFLQASWVRKSSYAVGLMLGIMIISIGGTKITGLLPEALVPLRLLIPPVSAVMDALMNADSLAGGVLLTTFAHAFLYAALLAGLYLHRSGRMDYGKI
ncbi:hypothetical protein GCM10010912_06760 [Paenibacillus albidus]|uniref:Uncharacterized protein n=1 Tax=Paenibacillus albidus TaxID=2041023 RepID=A0A917C0A1_9BACL|nr:hypothetical protein [Paenibacillus albidus]GGF64345.1 hypothetical protein GCM10010912_06760 [Paenibacillus albidus]